jgi:D-glycero-D-manno-heptose 1,7-bisphosphate phosphatase
MTIKTIFLDRDGVINMDNKYIYKPDDFVFIPGIFDICFYFQKLGYKIVVITNQSGIARGYFNEKQYQELTNWVLNKFSEKNIDILDILYCPHGPESRCSCRKPKPGMFIEAKKKHNIYMKDSWMIGDSERDITAASLAGITNTILVRSGNKIEQENSKAKYRLNSIKDIKDVVKF